MRGGAPSQPLAAAAGSPPERRVPPWAEPPGHAGGPNGLEAGQRDAGHRGPTRIRVPWPRPMTYEACGSPARGPAPTNLCQGVAASARRATPIAYRTRRGVSLFSSGQISLNLSVPCRSLSH